MTKVNYRFKRRLTESNRIREINEKNYGDFKQFLKSASELSEDYEGVTIKAFGLEVFGEPVGAIQLISLEDNIEVINICVSPDELRMGYGSLLLIKAKEYAMEQGFTSAAVAIPDDKEDLLPFFTGNGFFPGEEEEGGLVVVWEEDFEKESLLSEDEEETLEAAENVPPMAAFLVPKLMRLKAILESEGISSEVVSGEQLYLWTDCENYDIQVSYLVEDSTFSKVYLLFSSFTELEASDTEKMSICRDLNKTCLFATAFPAPDGIAMRYALTEAGGPVDQTLFTETLSEFRAEVETIIARLSER